MTSLLLFVALARGGSPQEVSPETAARFQKALAKLESDDLPERAEASREIRSLPSEVLILVETTLKNKPLDLETRSRLQELVPRLKAKIKKEESNRKRESDVAWTRKTVLEPLKHAEWKDAPWVPKAQEALETMVQIWGLPGHADPGLCKRAYALTQEAIQAGCGDPIVLYADARLYELVVRKDYIEAFRIHLHAANRMRDIGGAYHPLRQALAFGRAAEFHARYRIQLTEEDKKASQVWLDLGLKRYEEALKDPEIPEFPILDCSNVLIAAATILTHDRRIGFERVFDILSKARPESLLPLLLKGEFYTSFAWDARGWGPANGVKPEGVAVIRERLALAESALTEAWTKKPDHAKAATLMLTVELGQGKGREVMETWFKRAMEADPNNLEACQNKMFYLEPKWYGSRDAMKDFGRELLKGGNFDARLPFLLVEAHHTAATYEKYKSDYYKNEDVWKDIREVYSGYLEDFPEAAFERTQFARLAGQCGRYSDADRQFEILGDKADPSVFGGVDSMNRRKADAAAKGR